MTLRQAILWVQHKHPWTTQWWRLGEVTIHTPGRVWSTRDMDMPCPANITALACSGEIPHRGLWAWVGWDLDVGHGKKAYRTTAAALMAARVIRSDIGRCEIRLSKSGRGVHVRHLLPFPVMNGPQIAKEVAKRLRILVDPASCGRQMLTLWAREVPGEDSFRLIEPLFDPEGKS